MYVDIACARRYHSLRGAIRCVRRSVHAGSTSTIWMLLILTRSVLWISRHLRVLVILWMLLASYSVGEIVKHTSGGGLLLRGRG